MSEETEVRTAPEIIEEDRALVKKARARDDLIGWDIRFLENCDKRLDRRRALHGPQRDELRKILSGRD